MFPNAANSNVKLTKILLSATLLWKWD